MIRLEKVVNWLLSIKKTLVAVANFLVVLLAAINDGTVTTSEWWLIGAAFIAIFGVYNVTNLVGAVSRKK